MQKKIQMNISDQGLRDILELKDKLYASTMADVIRSSLKFMKKLEEEKRAGNKIIIVDKKGNQRELLI